MLRNYRLSRLALISQKAESQLTVAEKQYNYDYDELLRKRTIFKIMEVVFVDRLPLAISTNESKSTDKLTYRTLLPRIHGPR